MLDQPLRAHWALLTRTLAVTDIPGLNRSKFWSSANVILTGMRCTIFVKLPVALSGGIKADAAPDCGASVKTRPLHVRDGKASTRIFASLPAAIRLTCVSLKLAMIHGAPCTRVATVVPGPTVWPGRTLRAAM